MLKVETSIGPVWVTAAEPRHKGDLAHIREVIEGDCYRMRKLKADGFRPKFMLDVGCAIGTASLLAKHIWPGLNIFSVEPHCLPATERNLENKAVVFKSALAGFAGSPRMDDYIPRTTEDWQRYHAAMLRIGAVSVKDLFHVHKLPCIDLLKIDCEGAEAGILAELNELGLLAEIQHVVGEWHFDFNRRSIPDILHDTHDVDLIWTGYGPPKKNEWNLFFARAKA